MKETSILVVDDDPKLRALLVRCFGSEGYVTHEAWDRVTTFDRIAAHSPDLITLDLHLGSESGLDIAKQVRSSHTIPIVMVTGKDDVLDRVVGLEIGADDYITKPFHVREVLARIRAVLRRSGEHQTSRADTGKDTEKTNTFAQFDGWEVTPSTFKVIAPNGESCELTTADFNLLMVFLERPKRVLSREQIMDLLGGPSWTPLDRTIDNQVARLRKKLEIDPGKPALIKTIRGIGYSFVSDVSWS